MLRFAPSPTGDMHIGNLRVALLNYIVAKQRNEDFLIRIEDTDKERNVDNGTEEILNTLDMFGIKYNAVEKQSESDYSSFIDILSKVTVQGIIPKPCNPVKYNDVLRGSIKVKAKDMEEFRAIREDNSPLYNFACAVDDTRHPIHLIIRGEDHLSNTAKQVHIKTLLGLQDAEYLHLPIIKDVSGKKLSKRDSSSSVDSLVALGYLPSAITNYLLGMGYDSSHEIYTLDEAIAAYDVSKLSLNQPTFDIVALDYYNREHMKLLTDGEICNILELKGLSPSAASYFRLFIGHHNTTQEIKQDVLMIFKLPEKEVSRFFNGYNTKESFSAFLQHSKKHTGLKGKDLYKALRKVMTGLTEGPDLEEVYNTLYLNKTK